VSKKSESTVLKEALLNFSRWGFTLFRNNVGLAWTGQSTKFTSMKTVVVNPGDVIIRKARPFHAGLIKGASDLIGWKTVEITPDMVGDKIGVFAAIECKTKQGKLTKEQDNFIKQVKLSGGHAEVYRG